jgi:hypothetical protein
MDKLENNFVVDHFTQRLLLFSARVFLWVSIQPGADKKMLLCFSK